MNTLRQDGSVDNDDLLIERFKNGDRVAFDEIYNRYKDRIFNYMRRMIGNKETAEELAQEVFINIYMSIAAYKPKGLFKAWIYTIASNLVKNELKKKSYKINILLSKPITGAENNVTLENVLASEAFSSRHIIENNELKEQIESVIKSLPPIYKEVIVLCLIEGLSYEEAAQVLKTNVKTISSRLARARKLSIQKIKTLRKMI